MAANEPVSVPSNTEVINVPIGISREQFEALKREAEKHKAAQRQFAEALGVLWNSQLDMIIPTGNVSLLERVLARPLNLFNDCDCCGNNSIMAV